ncbi:hypothetical protein HPB49_008616 [Dermacentor silvarum]|uniref:Uncharacterized protein n=1 Tax=Dermacentor silvarum TaxID=543639 RepID=A0ACB8DXN2_DERSI|nr:hypothetical protein HPB49_008616 [Dermacentor silvarum]
MFVKRYLAVPDCQRDIPDKLQGQGFCLHSHDNDVLILYRPHGDTSVRATTSEGLHCGADPAWTERSVEVHVNSWLEHNHQLIWPDLRCLCRFPLRQLPSSPWRVGGGTSCWSQSCFASLLLGGCRRAHWLQLGELLLHLANHDLTIFIFSGYRVLRVALAASSESSKTQ